MVAVRDVTQEEVPDCFVQMVSLTLRMILYLKKPRGSCLCLLKNTVQVCLQMLDVDFCCKSMKGMVFQSC